MSTGSRLCRPRQTRGRAAQLLSGPADLSFEWRAPGMELLLESEDGSISIEKKPATHSGVTSYEMAPYQGAWVNFADFLCRHEPKQMISTFGFLRGGNRDARGDWQDMLFALTPARSLWGDLEPQETGAPALAFAASETSIEDATSTLRRAIRGAIEDDGIAVRVQMDLDVQIRPTDLRAFMLLDAAEAIHTRALYLECINCEWIFRHPDKRQRSFCSTACRSQYNQKNFLARQ